MSVRKIKLILKDFEMNNYAETNTQIYQLNTKQNTYLLVSIQVLKAKYLIFQLLSYKSDINNKSKLSCTARITFYFITTKICFKGNFNLKTSSN